MAFLSTQIYLVDVKGYVFLTLSAKNDFYFEKWTVVNATINDISSP